jgi:hypothetical protein
MGDSLSDNALESFSKLQQRMFVKGTDDADCMPEFKEMFDDLRSTSGKTELNNFLEDAKPILYDPDSNLPGTDLPFPLNNGFVGATTQKTFNVGDVLDRFGQVGNWLAEGDPPRWARSLPNSTPATKFRYRVKKAFTKEFGRTAPWYGEPGGGLQVYLAEGINVKAFFDEHLERIID